MFLPTGYVKFVNWSTLHNIRGAGRKRSRKISTLSCHVLSCQKVGCLVEEIYLSYSEENNQVSYNSDPNLMPRYGGKPSFSALWSTGVFKEQCIILHWILEFCAIGSALVDGGLLDCNGLQWQPMRSCFNSICTGPCHHHQHRFFLASSTSLMIKVPLPSNEHHKGWNFVEVQVHPHFLGRCQIFESTLLPVFMSRITFVGILSLW